VESTIAAGVQVTSTGDYIYQSDLSDLPETSLIDEQGQPLGGGCVFASSGSGAAAVDGPRVVAMEEVSFNPSTCMRRIAVAEYPVDQAPQAVKELMVQSSEGEIVVEQGSLQLPGLAPQANKTYKATLNSYIKDPVGLHTTETWATVKWTADSKKVYSASYTHKYGMIDLTGWKLKTNHNYHGVTTSYAYANTTAKMQNNTFCKLLGVWQPTTYGEHNKTYVKGLPNGGWAWEDAMYKHGGCDWMLSYGRTFTKP
jgi:hypothetical protein